MQLNTFRKYILFILTVLVLIQLTLNFKLEETDSNCKKAEKISILRNKNRIKSKFKLKIKNNFKNKLKQAPYNEQSAIQLIKDLGNVVLLQDDKTARVFGVCMNYISNEARKFWNLLNEFWLAMSRVASHNTQWDNNSFIAIINAVAGKTVDYNSNKIPCGSLRLQNNIEISKIKIILSQDIYFGGFNNFNTKKQKFVEGMVSHHRDMIDASTFEKINQVSRSESSTDNTTLPSYRSSNMINNNQTEYLSSFRHRPALQRFNPSAFSGPSTDINPLSRKK
jgi:hypothetical protein